MLLNAKEIGRRIKNIRKTENLSQEEFAEVIETSSRTVSNVENGLVIPSLQTIANIAEQYHVSIDSIIGRELQ